MSSECSVEYDLAEMKNMLPSAYMYDGLPMIDFYGNGNGVERAAACTVYERFREDDVFVWGYPKSGNHLATDIVKSIKLEDLGLNCTNQDGPIKRIFFESGRSSAESFADPTVDFNTTKSRTLVTHFPWRLLPSKVKNGSVKVIRIDRDPRGVCCSMYPYLQKLDVIVPECSFDQFIELFIDGHAPFGHYYEWKRDAKQHQEEMTLLNLAFEEIVSDLKTAAIKISNFLGITLNKTQLDRVVQANTIKNKKKLIASIGTSEEKATYRSGIPDSWKNELTAEQMAKLNKWMSTNES